MARDSERLAADAFTRASVEDYLQAAAEQRARIELAIAEAERRRERAVDALQRLDGLTAATGRDPALPLQPIDREPTDGELADGPATDLQPTDPEAADAAGPSPNGSAPGHPR